MRSTQSATHRALSDIYIQQSIRSAVTPEQKRSESVIHPEPENTLFIRELHHQAVIHVFNLHDSNESRYDRVKPREAREQDLYSLLGISITSSSMVIWQPTHFLQYGLMSPITPETASLRMMTWSGPWSRKRQLIATSQKNLKLILKNQFEARA